jgi:hypothetical protein
MAIVVVSENPVSFIDGVTQQAFLPRMNRCVDFLEELGVWVGLRSERNNRQYTE